MPLSRLHSQSQTVTVPKLHLWNIPHLVLYMSEDTDTHTERFLNIEKPFKTDNRFTASLTKAPAKSIHLTELITFPT